MYPLTEVGSVDTISHTEVGSAGVLEELSEKDGAGDLDTEELWAEEGREGHFTETRRSMNTGIAFYYQNALGCLR